MEKQTSSVSLERLPKEYILPFFLKRIFQEDMEITQTFTAKFKFEEVELFQANKRLKELKEARWYTIAEAVEDMPQLAYMEGGKELEVEIAKLEEAVSAMTNAGALYFYTLTVTFEP